MIFTTGDFHGGREASKLNMKNFPIQEDLTKDDYVIIAGDFGAVWGGEMEKNSKYWQEWLNNKNFTTLFVDGNHEDFGILDSLPVEIWKGGKISKVSDSIYHLKRGQVFEIDGKKIFTMGGAVSVDKKWRKENVTWWAREVPSKEELDEGIRNLAKHCNEVDYIITHSAPKRFISELSVNKHNKEFECDLDFFLDDIYDNIKFKQFFCGHFHCDKKVSLRFTSLFDDVVLIGNVESSF